MSFFKKFLVKDKPIKSYSDFWDWFVQNEGKFHKVIKNQGDINKVFFSKLAPKLNELKDGFWFLTGMYDNDIAELILTADGTVKNIVFVEELVDAAPKINGWKITALKPPSKANTFAIEMGGYKFDETTMSFYSNELSGFPDEIDITITHKDLMEENRSEITNGVYLSLDNSLGELKSISLIDNLNVINTKDALNDLVPIDKLNDFLIWREKEFVEKYDGIRYNTDKDNFTGLEAKLKNGLPLIAIVNADLLSWDSKASHPWIAVLEIEYDGKENKGMPNKVDYDLMNNIEEEILLKLKDFDGYLNVGRQTAENIREIYFACTDFRKPSKVFYEVQSKYAKDFRIEFDIYRDKYWQSFERFISN
ncbi:DUF695 domain-containing protein [Hwangdonia seohaensis]|uniref:DUF695 domain-containing protein n=1 Tax=Hwangdonia seohaensis TaxID=1240727 RepID=A0ABW3RA87_9FLAO|nr:DUF695 domain-containing protein [Hwangdonia seohaensis]